MSSTPDKFDPYWTAHYGILGTVYDVEKAARQVASDAADIATMASQAYRHVEKHRPEAAEWDRLTDIEALIADLDNLKRALEIFAAGHAENIGIVTAGPAA